MKQCIVLLLLLANMCLLAQNGNRPSFHVVPLGVKGGIDESNLSAYLVAPAGSKDYICLDAGTIYAGIEKAIANKTFQGTVSSIQKNYIKGYFISHAHLDHVSGLIITSPDDSSKTVYALPACMKMLQDYYFNGEAWANFGDEGKSFLLKKYHFQTLKAGQEININNTSMHVTPFSLSHVNPYESTAFLVRHNNAYLLYLGDTGPDEIEKSTQLKKLWEAMAPLIITGKLKGIFIEVSFPNEQPDQFLFGHLTPNYLIKELHVLEELAGKDTLKGFKIIVTHLKPPTKNITKINEQLKNQNDLGVQLIYPEQGKRFDL